MPDFSSLVQALGALPPGALSASLILAAFGLAAYSIYAVVSVVKGKDRS